MDEQEIQRLKQENLRLRATINQLEDKVTKLASLKGSLFNIIKKIILKLDYFGIIDAHKSQFKKKLQGLKTVFLKPKSSASRINQGFIKSSINLADSINSSEVDVLMSLRLTFGHASLSDATNFIKSIADIQHILCIGLSSDYFHIIDLLLKMKKEITLVESTDYRNLTNETVLYVFSSKFDTWLAKEKYGRLTDYDAIFIAESSPKHYFNLFNGRLLAKTKIFVLPIVS